MKQGNLFKTKFVPAKKGSGNLFEETFGDSASGPVTCLGMTFNNDEARRDHFTEELRKKLNDPEFRKIEGFPIGRDDDILNLSDPPYYTACPNPWIADFIRFWEAEKSAVRSAECAVREENSAECEVRSAEETHPAPRTSHYHREPFAADVSEGKNDPIYNAHSYHTKVPHKAIMRYILHYTEPGDIVFDGFCGTGMTGVAAQLCGDRGVVMSLGYQVKPDGSILQQEVDEEGKKVWKPFSKLGVRRAVLNDLSPAATFIAYNYNTPVDVAVFEKEAKRILAEVEEECGWMYETLHVEPASSRLISELNFLPCDPFQATEVKYRRDHLPHIQVPGATYFITFRTEKFRILSPAARKLALNAILFWDNQRWKVFSAVVMPDHIHLIARPLLKKSRLEASQRSRLEAGSTWNLSEILHSIKSFSANEINKLEGTTGVPVWQSESYDRIVRDAGELANELAYLNHNPVKVGLVQRAEEYEWRYVAPELEKAGWKPAPLGKINYTVWSETFNCPHCGKEIIYFNAAVDDETFAVNAAFNCPSCSAELDKKSLQRQWQSYFDGPLNATHRQVRYTPVLINYQIGKNRFEKKPDAIDLSLLNRIEKTPIPDWFPTFEMPDGERKRKDGYHLKGITHLHHFYFRRAMMVYSKLWNKSQTCSSPFVRFFVQGNGLTVTKMNRYRRTAFSQVNQYMSGTLFVGSLISEVSPEYSMTNKLKRLLKLSMPGVYGQTAITCQSTTNIQAVPTSSIDYIFIDPPFGNNLHYSELNFFWEAWLKVLTERKPEAVMDKGRSRTLHDYQVLMSLAFQELHRVLKSGRWMTIEFHNSSNSVWVAIQEALEQVGFVVADVRTLDKQQETYKQSIQKLVKQDLVISAYKPNGGLEDRFKLEAGTEEGVWDFVRTHLKQLPVFVAKAGQLELVPERMNYLLFDRMIAFHVRRGVMVPMNASDFYAGLEQRFSVREEMYFLPYQAIEFDKKRITVAGIQQISLFVTDETSAIQWLRQLIKEKPQSTSDINPQFMKQLGAYSKNEQMLELSTILEQNFLCYVEPASSRLEPVPEQIHAYLSTNWKELRNLPKDDPTLIAKARDRWYVPDPNKAGDLEKLREKALLKEFEQYVSRLEAGSTKKLKVFRLEAVRAGFKKAWQERDYAVIVAVADKIPNNVLEEDPKLLMWYDQAVTRMGGE